MHKSAFEAFIPLHWRDRSPTLISCCCCQRYSLLFYYAYVFKQTHTHTRMQIDCEHARFYIVAFYGPSSMLSASQPASKPATLYHNDHTHKARTTHTICFLFRFLFCSISKCVCKCVHAVLCERVVQLLCTLYRHIRIAFHECIKIYAHTRYEGKEC